MPKRRRDSSPDEAYGAQNPRFADRDDGSEKSGPPRKAALHKKEGAEWEDGHDGSGARSRRESGQVYRAPTGGKAGGVKRAISGRGPSSRVGGSAS